MSKKNEYVQVAGASYHAPTIAKMSWDEFKAQADAEAKASKSETLHFGAWGDQRDAKLKEVWEAATAMMKPADAQPESAPPADAGKKKP